MQPDDLKTPDDTKARDEAHPVKYTYISTKTPKKKKDRTAEQALYYVMNRDKRSQYHKEYYLKQKTLD